MKRNNRSAPRRGIHLSVEALDHRQLLSGIAAAPAAVTGHYARGQAFVEWSRPAMKLSGRVMTPELRQAMDAAARQRAAHFALRQAASQRRVQADAIARPMVVTAAPGPLAPDQLRFIARAIPANAQIVTQAIIDLTNFVRTENHLPPLSANAALMEGAQLHSQDMARLDRMQHDLASVPLSSLTDRAAFVHYSYQLLGENIAYNQADPASVVASWMQSLPHRENMLNPSFTDIGVGLSWNRRGEPFYTMMLGQPA
jgi:uncharacterized protein YkwD